MLLLLLKDLESLNRFACPFQKPTLKLLCGLFVLGSLLSASPGFAQNKPAAQTNNYFVELGGLQATAGRTPFWLQANQFGIVPRSGSALTLRGAAIKDWRIGRTDAITRWRLERTPNPPPQWNATLGVEVVGNLGATQSNILLPQIYGAIRFGKFEVSVGRRREWVGLADSTLGTGSFIWSGNAMPVPRIQIGFTRFTPVPLTGGWVSILATYSDGRFERNRAVTSELLLHQKQLYGRLGRPNSLIKLYGGFNHQVQWGGKSPYQTINNQMPKGLDNYLRVVTGQASDKQLDTATTTAFDNENRVGNHLGTIDLALEVNGKRTNWLFYRQSIYEDGSLYYLNNIIDGLHGIRFRRKNHRPGAVFSLREIVVEGLYTLSQGGTAFENTVFRGRDNYFNNVQVRDGWSYYDRTIGTPFIPPTTDTEWKYPRYADFFTSNSRVWVAHLGMRGTVLDRVAWSTRLSYSANEGVYDLAFPETAYQFSGVLGLQYQSTLLNGLIIKGALAVDRGDLYPDNIGGTLSFRKNLTPKAKASPLK